MKAAKKQGPGPPREHGPHFAHRLGHSLGRRFLHSSIRSALLFSVLAVASWGMGVPFLWPSLGPTTYLLVFDRDRNQRFLHIFGAHAIGGFAGLLTHQLFAPHLSIQAMLRPMGSHSFHIALSSIIALTLTIGIMRATRWVHSPACATTLITALGLISGFLGVVYIMAAVIMLHLTHQLTERVFERLGWITKPGA